MMLAVAMIVMGLAVASGGRAARRNRQDYPGEPLSPGMDYRTATRSARAKALAPLARPFEVLGLLLIVLGAVLGVADLL